MNRFYVAEIEARKHLNEVHGIYEALDLPSYVDYSYTPVEVVAMMRMHGECDHEDVYKDVPEA